MFIKTPTSLQDAFIIEPQVFADERGFFLESYSRDEFTKIGIMTNFVQDNHSKSKKYVLRGLHFQTKKPQAKLVRVLAGAVYDVIVDLRRGSPTFGKWEGFFLDADSKKMLFVPRGFAHGFVTLADDTEFFYKCDDYYDAGYEGGIMYDDKTLNINWGEYADTDALVISEKDQKHASFEPSKMYFGYQELTKNTYVYIDMQNVWQSLKNDGWLIDWKKFMIYLRDKFRAKKVYLFVGYVMKNQELYERLISWGYEIIFKETREIKGQVKGNVDAELVVQAMKDIDIFSRAILVSSDGDFACLIDEWNTRGKLGYIVSPNSTFCSSLLKKRAKGTVYDLLPQARKFSKKIQ